MAHQRNRRGATLLELLVALLLFDLVFLALAGASALAARRIGDANRRQRALIATSARVEGVAASPCTMVSSGQASPERGVSERWSTSIFPGGRTLRDSAIIASHGALPVSAGMDQAC